MSHSVPTIFALKPLSDLKQLESLQKASAKGPGTTAHQLFVELGLKPKAGCKCGERIKQMNDLGVQGCIANRETVISWWREAYHESTILERAKAGWHALSKPWFSLTDPFGSIFDEAMRRADNGDAANITAGRGE